MSLHPLASRTLAVTLAVLAGACGDAATGGTDAAGDTTSSTAPAPADVAEPDAVDTLADAADDATPVRRDLVVMSYNVMCSFCPFDEHPTWDTDFDQRMAWVRDTIARHDPDLIGVQELADMDPGHPDQAATVGGDTYAAIYYHRQPDDPSEWDYPDAVAYYRKSRFDLLDQGVFWLSPTPDVPFAHGWTSGLAFTRLVVWASLHDRATGRDLTFASTHFDNNSPNQDYSAPLCLERFAPVAAAGPLVFVGDFNSAPASTAYATLAGGVDGAGFHFENAFDLAAHGPRQDTSTETPPAWDPAERIDHVWLAGASFQVSDWVVDLHTYGPAEQAASDHWAIATTLSLDP